MRSPTAAAAVGRRQRNAAGNADTGGTHRQRGLKSGRPTAGGRGVGGQSGAARHVPTPLSGRGSARPTPPAEAAVARSAAAPPGAYGAGWGPEPGGLSPILSRSVPSPRSGSDPVLPPATVGRERRAQLPRRSPLAADDSLCFSQLIYTCIYFSPPPLRALYRIGLVAARSRTAKLPGRGRGSAGRHRALLEEVRTGGASRSSEQRLRFPAPPQPGPGPIRSRSRRAVCWSREAVASCCWRRVLLTLRFVTRW